MSQVISIDPNLMHGTPCFAGTRVPIKNLFDYLDEGHPLPEFFEDFPGVSEDQVHQLLVMAKELVLAQSQSETAHENFAG